MRYKFRAWFKGRMHSTHNDDVSVCMDGSVMIRLEDGHTWDFDAWGLATVMQWTGLKDKKGKDIYEGDIARCGYGIGVVVYKCGCYMIEWIDDPQSDMEFVGLNKTGRRMREDEEVLEVIGNIYQNPELLVQ